jgi:hypothetical protein
VARATADATRRPVGWYAKLAGPRAICLRLSVFRNAVTRLISASLDNDRRSLPWRSAGLDSGKHTANVLHLLFYSQRRQLVPVCIHFEFGIDPIRGL